MPSLQLRAMQAISGLRDEHRAPLVAWCVHGIAIVNVQFEEAAVRIVSGRISQDAVKSAPFFSAGVQAVALRTSGTIFAA